MADRHGILVTIKVKEGMMTEFLEVSKAHFVRQHDGREANATCASIILPLPGEPNTIRFFEQVCRVYITVVCSQIQLFIRVQMRNYSDEGIVRSEPAMHT